jgi:O-antigen/teichoic acid export membrane protein
MSAARASGAVPPIDNAILPAPSTRTAEPGLALVRRSRRYASGFLGSENTLTRNALFVMLTTLVNAGLGAIYWSVAAHRFSPSAIGVATAVVSAMMLASLITCSGLGTTLLEILPHRHGEAWSRAVAAVFAAGAVAGCIAGLICVAVLPMTSTHLNDLRTLGWMIAVPLSVSFFSAATLTDYLFLAEKRADLSLARTTTFGVVKIGLVIVAAAAFGHGTALGVYLTWGAALLVSLGPAWVFATRLLKRSVRAAWHGLGGELRTFRGSIAGHHLLNALALLTGYMLPLVVTIRLSTNANAYFYIAWMVGNIFFVISASASGSFMAEASAHPERLMHLAVKTFRLVLVVLAPVALGVILLGHFALGLFGATYASRGYGLLMILLASAIPDAITNISVVVLRVQRRFAAAATINGVIAVATIGGAWLLARRDGLDGIGWAWAIAQCMGCVVVMILWAGGQARRRGVA